MSDVVDDFLAHYGKKGMRWGQRRAIKKTQRADNKWERKANTVKTYIAVHNEAANMANKIDVPRINNSPRYKGKDFTVDSPLRREYYKAHEDAFNKRRQEAADKIVGLNPSGTKKIKIYADGSAGFVSVKHSSIIEHAVGESKVVLIFDDMGHIVEFKILEDSLEQAFDVDDFLAHYGKKGMRWGVRNKRTASVELTSNKTGQKKKIYYNPKKLDPNGPTVGNKRQISATRREGKNFQKQLNKASKELKPKAKDLSDEELRKAVNRMNMEKQYNSLIGNNSKKDVGAKFIKGIAGTAVKTALTAVATQQVNSAFKKAKITK